MSREQRFFLTPGFFVVSGIVLGLPFCSLQAEDRITISDDRVSFVLPDGWQKSDLNATVVEAGYETQDKRTSAFFTKYAPGIQGSMQDLMDMTIEGFEKQFFIEKESESVTGQVQGPGDKKFPAIFKTLEAKVTRNEDEFEMRFYLLIFDVGTRLYLLQATTTKPVREAREKQVYELIRSLVAKP